MTKIYTLADLKAKCKKLNVELDTSRHSEYVIYSPNGYRLVNGSGTHISTASHMTHWKKEDIQSLMHDLESGLEKCPKNCECKEYD